MVKAELIEKFKMKQTASAANLKSHIGESLRVDKWEFSEYVDADGAYHNVLAIKIANTGEILRTEVSAFIEKFKEYIEAFGEEKLEDRPLVKITGKKSKKNNEYISFEIVDESGNPL